MTLIMGAKKIPSLQKIVAHTHGIYEDTTAALHIVGHTWPTPPTGAAVKPGMTMPRGPLCVGKFPFLICVLYLLCSFVYVHMQVVCVSLCVSVRMYVCTYIQYIHWRWRIVATMVPRVTETPRWSICREFGRQVVVRFLQLSLSSCVVSKSLYKLHQLA